MHFEYNYSGPMNSEIGTVFMVVYGLLFAGSALVGLTMFVIRGIGLYTIAKRRGLSHPWLVWVPVGNQWMTGSFSDQYRYLVKGEVRNMRKLLLALSAVNTVLAGISGGVSLETAGKLMMAGGGLSEGQMASVLLGPAVGVLIVVSVLAVLILVEYVLRQMCMYDLYRSCDPGNAVAYLVLGILFPVLEPIFLIVLRKRDGGMPPRREIPHSSDVV